MRLNFWYTDLSEDAGFPWYSCHLYVGCASNGNPKLEIDQCFSSLIFWKLRLLIKAIAKQIHLAR